MERETKTVRFEIKQLDEQGVFEGFASVFGNEDLGGDIVHFGAFSKTIQDRKGRVPLLRNHRDSVGITYMEETDHGLAVKGKLNLEKQGARDTYSDMRFYQEHGMPMGMSFGYDMVKGETKEGVRHLYELKVYETTLTEFPMNPEATVTDVKSQDSAEVAKVETKAGRRLSAATRKKLQDLMDSLQALMAEEADSTESAADDTSNAKEAAVTESVAATTSDAGAAVEEETPEADTKALEFLTSLTEDLRNAFGTKG